MDKIIEKKPTIKSRLLQFIENQSISKTDFCKKTGISYSNIKGKAQKSELGGEQISKILEVYKELSPEWLLTGFGFMLRDSSTLSFEAESSIFPLISQRAFLNWSGKDIPCSEIKDYYNIPLFKHLHIDFLIEVCGSTMSPYLNNGDIVACSIMQNLQFIQWNRCYLIATHSQEVLCKRLRSSKRKNCFTAVSENPKFPPFNIPECDICHIALVQGRINME